MLRGHTSEVTALAFTPDGKTLASGDRGGMIRFWDLSAEPPRFREFVMVQDNMPVCRLAFSPEGGTLIIASSESLELWTLGPAAPKQRARMQSP
ncbi:MAG: hypothetical protein WKF75_06810, partial [Singulisphaera sp.]